MSFVSSYFQRNNAFKFINCMYPQANKEGKMKNITLLFVKILLK